MDASFTAYIIGIIVGWTGRRWVAHLLALLCDAPDRGRDPIAAENIAAKSRSYGSEEVAGSIVGAAFSRDVPCREVPGIEKQEANHGRLDGILYRAFYRRLRRFFYLRRIGYRTAGR